MKKHTSGTKIAHGESIGPGPVAGAGYVKTGGPGKAAQKQMNMRPAGGKFQGGASSYKPGKMSVQRSGE